MGFKKKFRKLKMIAYDFDGVMTDNKVLVDQNGVESVMVSRGDGYGISRIRELGIEQVIISTEPNPVVCRRAEKLKLPVIHDVADKRTILQQYCCEKGYDYSEVMFIGNDLNDFEAMQLAGVKGAPKDAEEEILAIADWISGKKGGDGVIRDLYRELSKVRETVD